VVRRRMVIWSGILRPNYMLSAIVCWPWAV
jgi:hypothetical protein